MLLSGISPMGFGRSLCPPPTPEAPDEVEEFWGDEGRWCRVWKPSPCHQVRAGGHLTSLFSVEGALVIERDKRGSGLEFASALRSFESVLGCDFNFRGVRTQTARPSCHRGVPRVSQQARSSLQFLSLGFGVFQREVQERSENRVFQLRLLTLSSSIPPPDVGPRIFSPCAHSLLLLPGG